MKKFTSILLAILMLFSITIVSANAVTATENSTTKTTAVEVPVLTIPEDFSQEEAIEYVEDNGARGIFVDGWATYAFVRNPGRPDTCQLYINWSGELASAFRCKKIVIKSTDLLFPKTYDSSGDGVTYKERKFPASTHASTFWDVYDIPYEEDRVTVYTTSAQVYIHSNARWVSAAKNNYTTTIDN